jgi:hypothetical protein
MDVHLVLIITDPLVRTTELYHPIDLLVLSKEIILQILSPSSSLFFFAFKIIYLSPIILSFTFQ